jgi:1A family penicillin-binding protein
MPIPPLKKNQTWKKEKKKYYIPKNSSYKVRTKVNSSFKSKKNKNSFFKKIILNKLFLKISLVLIFLFFIFIFGFFIWLSKDLPKPEQLMERQIAQSTKIYDRSGENVLYEIHGNEQRTIVALDDMPSYIKNATIAIEDKNFYNHGGISVWGILRGVVWQTIKGNRAQGGSTLTQQLVKNAILTNERKIVRKLKEWILAYRIEKKYSKDEILQMYFNEIPYGSTSYGIEAAAKRYFDKSAKDLNLPEAAILAALPQAPSRYSPYGPNKELLLNRKDYILDLMHEQNYITEAKRDAAKLYELEFKKQSTNITAPHFVMYVKELLAEKYGEKTVEQEGFKIITTLDLYKQKIAEDVIREESVKNLDYNATNASLISIDPKTGQILTMVGSKDYFSEEIDGQVNITTSLRQPGSSLKPLVYAALFEKGYNPNTVLYDVLTNFSNNENEPYEPRNYNNNELGPVSIKKALAGSLNIPAVKAIYLAGVENVLDLAKKAGYTSLSDKDRFGLSLVLGGGEVKLMEHANAFSIFAREGVVHPISAILRIEDKDGNIIEEFKEPKEKKVLDVNIARMINDILSDNNARAYAFGESNWLTLGNRPVGAKTGTTNDYKDAWTIGYTPSIITGVWVGNNNSSEMKRGAAGGVVAAPIWQKYMKQILGDTPIEYFKKPEIKKTGKPVIDGNIESGTVVRIDKASGLLATEHTPPEYIEEQVFQQAHSILYYVNKDNPLGDTPKNPEKDPQFTLWESRVLEWAERENFATSSPPTEYDNLHKEENKPTFDILSPSDKQTISESFFTSRIEASAPRGVNKVKYYINNNLVLTTYSYPFSLEKQLTFLDNGYHNLKIEVCDDVDNCSEKSIEFNLILDNDVSFDPIEISFFDINNGQALNNIDFPFVLKIKNNNPEQVAKIKTFYKQKEENEYNLLHTSEPITDQQTNVIWQSPPKSGTYELYAEAFGWGGQNNSTEKITINVNNINE